MNDVEISIHDHETLRLMPERSVFWPRASTLFIADVHLGLADAAATESDLARLSAALKRTGAEKLIILGDLVQAVTRRRAEAYAQFSAWRVALPDLPIYLIRGNHERAVDALPAEWKLSIADGPTHGPYFVLTHEPYTPRKGYALAGHMHPCYSPTDSPELSLPCFRFMDQCAHLPAFGTRVRPKFFTPAPTERLFVVRDDSVSQV